MASQAAIAAQVDTRHSHGKSAGQERGREVASALAVVADELDSAVARALARLQQAGVSNDIAWQALEVAIETVQRCLIAVDDETDRPCPASNHQA